MVATLEGYGGCLPRVHPDRFYIKFVRDVKSNFQDESKETLKPAKSVAIRFIDQGCKKEKGADTDDFGHCMACEFGLDIFVSK